jgi:hypothetical protein
MSFRNLIESDEWMLYNIIDNMVIRGHGYQGKQPFKSEAEARRATPRDDDDYVAIKVKDFIKKFPNVKI